jgi:hypothetical protein
MLITNFSAGELSKTLFGRTDLPQYYSGAARLENFDVIPTGGLKRRSGMEFLAKLDGGGRLIPFVVDRDLGFLLYLTPGKIQVYQVKEGALRPDVTEVSSVGGRELYREGEIWDVQYAQNFDTMILCHENHPPLEVKLKDERLAGLTRLTINILELNFDVKLVHDEKVTEVDERSHREEDKQYEANGWLTTEGNYPAAVSFYNGRLVFACTKKNKQKLFFSAIREADEPYNFSTYKKILTEKKEYSVLFGQISKDDTSIINADPQWIINTFTKPAEKYRVDSQLYDPNAVIEYINLNRVKLTHPVKMPIMIFDIEAIEGELLEKVNAYSDNDDNPAEITVYTRSWEIDYVDLSTNTSYRWKHEGTVKCLVKGGSMDVIYLCRTFQNQPGLGWSEIKKEWATPFTKKAAETIENDGATRRTEIIGKINSFIQQDKDVPILPNQRIYHNTLNEYEAKKTESVDRLFDNIRATMYYELETAYGVEKFYNYPVENMSNVMARIINTDKTYIAFYTREILADEQTTPDCGFTLEPASDKSDAIRWLAVNKGLVVGTESGEWVVPPDVYAGNERIVQNSGYGSDRIQGTAMGDATVFFQAGKQAMVEYYIPQQDTSFRANNMALLSPDMLAESPVKDFDFMTSPHAKLLVTREDGTMATLLYERATGTFAWGRVTTGPEEVKIVTERKRWRVGDPKGRILSAAVLPHRSGDDVFLAVERVGRITLERLRDGGKVYLDCWREWTGEAQLDEYGPQAVVRDVNERKTYRKGDGWPPPSDADNPRYIGYPYTSVMRTLPALDRKGPMRDQRIVFLAFNFLDSFLPVMYSVTHGEAGNPETICSIEPPFTGVHRAEFPGTWDKMAQAEIHSDEPGPVTILAVDAVLSEAQ